MDGMSLAVKYFPGHIPGGENRMMEWIEKAFAESKAMADAKALADESFKRDSRMVMTALVNALHEQAAIIRSKGRIVTIKLKDGAYSIVRPDEDGGRVECHIGMEQARLLPQALYHYPNKLATWPLEMPVVRWRVADGRVDFFEKHDLIDADRAAWLLLKRIVFPELYAPDINVDRAERKAAI